MWTFEGQVLAGDYIRDQEHPTKLPVRISFLLFLTLVLNQVASSYGGTCWLDMKPSGLCSNLVQTGATKEECCSSGRFANSVSVSWSGDDGDKLDSSSYFKTLVVGGMPCKRCKETCDGVVCPENQKCAMRNGLPKCICSPNCSAFRAQHGLQHQHIRGPVCGSDGRTYKSTCRLLKRACRRKVALTISYYGPCKMSCSKLNCTSTKRCLMDQNMIPHCVNCSQRKCSGGINPRNSLKSVCGVDGLTYPSVCHLRQAACQNGKAIQIAYKGNCKKRANCSTVKCAEGQSCLIEKGSGRPRCVTCTRQKWCRKPERSQVTGPLCATNGKTYRNWCEMTEEACNTGIALDTERFGSCNNKADNYTRLSTRQFN